MKLYFDTAYLAKCYWNEPGGKLVRELARQADGLYSSAICIAEMACLAHRKVPGALPPRPTQGYGRICFSTT